MYGADDFERPQRMRPDQLNEMFREGQLVTKRFIGPGAKTRAHTESRALRAAYPVIPVPRWERAADTTVIYEYVPGRMGTQILNPDNAAPILAECGRLLAALHSVAVPARVEGGSGVFVHGDFGPHNLVFATKTLSITAVLDWEWAHLGRPVEDLAWCEWNVRTHHPECADALPHLYHGYNVPLPPWPSRQSAMLSKCRAMHGFAAQLRDGSATLWQRRTAITRAWRN